MKSEACCVLIPSLSPDHRLEEYADELVEAGFGGLIVVNDGSSAEYDPIFERLAAKDKVTVLRHDINRGKGQALRTGFAHILEHTDFQGVITADSDGQHTVKDTLHLAQLLEADKPQLLLGSRDFSRHSTQVPPKSRMGNRITSVVFHLLYGPKLPDTQTGLRAFDRSLIPMMLKVSGDRFEYEMNQLMYCARDRIPMVAVPIETIYHDENKGTHFHPVRDAWRIYKLIFGNFFRFMSASVICFLVDFILFHVLSQFVLPTFMPNPVALLGSDLRQLIATYGARVVSSVLNYKLNKRFVFSLKSCKGAPLRYFLLCVLAATVSGLLVGILHRLMPQVSPTIFKIPVDLRIFLVNYRLQQSWVFRPDPTEKESV
ncbi:MAG: bifunctional glycosyltransferase family 2/GtrA family protein [Clostridia bacterium]|nr:bifunctional glycosyltransferase family 2/GtrA family protein [Clostridia bacterium]